MGFEMDHLMQPHGGFCEQGRENSNYPVEQDFLQTLPVATLAPASLSLVNYPMRHRIHMRTSLIDRELLIDHQMLMYK
jgi:hypothetical protein